MIAYRELIRLHPMMSITMPVVIPDFGWLLVCAGGRLMAFNLKIMIPTHDRSTWLKTTKAQSVELSAPQEVAFVRLGMTKGRLLGESVRAGLLANVSRLRLIC